MPERVITKPPSAELRADQKDEDSLPPYEVLDAILTGLVADELSVAEVLAKGYDAATVQRIERLLPIPEDMPRPSPPGDKHGRRNFGRTRRYPLTNALRTS